MPTCFRFLLIALTGVFISANVLGQGLPVSIGNWRYHTPFIKSIAVEQAGDRIFCASRFGIFSYDKTDGSIARYTKLTGLSDFEITGMKYYAAMHLLMITYESSNIDLLNVDDNSIINVPDLKQKNIIGGKQINDVVFIGKYAYLATSFGILVVDLNRHEIKDTYYLGAAGTSIGVNSLAYNGNELLAATSIGVYTAALNDPNIYNYSGWTKDVAGFMYPKNRFTSATSFNGEFYVVNSEIGAGNDTVFHRQNGSWSPVLGEFNRDAALDSSGGYLVYIWSYMTAAYDAALSKILVMDGNVYYPPAVVDATVDETGQLWLADQLKGLVRLTFNPSRYPTVFCPTGPYSEGVYAMESRGGTLWVASGSLEGTAPDYSHADGTYVLHENEWTSFNNFNQFDSIYHRLSFSGRPSTVAVAIDPGDPNHAFFGNWRGGVIESNLNGGIRQYNESNSSLLSRAGLSDYITVGGICFDRNNTMWVTAGGRDTLLHARYSNGTWRGFRMPDASSASYWLKQVMVDDFDTKWILAYNGPSSGAGIMVYRENDASSASDDLYRVLNDRTGGGGLPDIFVRCMAKDKDGAIWVGTSKGVAVFYNPGDVFNNSNFDAQRIIIEQDGYAQYLLESEIVTAVAVDGGNRKWFGTAGGGVFLMSSDGTKQLLNFNVDNSPLPSNSITCIAIDDLTGEVFFGTEKGIVSYRGEAVTGEEYCDSYYAYPNPVKPDYNGPIAIRGLVDDADVRITDIAGNLVYHTVALGGQAIWYGKNFSGQRVATGVYLVYVTNPDGTSTCMTKLLMAK